MRSRYLDVGAIGKLTSTSEPSSVRETSKPASSNTFSIGRLSARTSATNRSMPASARPLGQPLQQPRADPAALMLVGDREGDLCSSGFPETHERRVRDEAAVELPDQRAALDPVRIHERLHELGPDRRQTVEATVEARLREAREQAGEGWAVGPNG